MPDLFLISRSDFSDDPSQSNDSDSDYSDGQHSRPTR